MAKSAPDFIKKSTATGSLQLRQVIEDDLPVFFDQQLDEEARHMAAFTSKDPANQEAFMRHWRKILDDETITIRSILFEGQLAGHVLIHAWFGEPDVSYWLGKEYWGRGIATRTLTAFLEEVTERPLYARAAKTTAPRCGCWRSAASRSAGKIRALPTRAAERWKSSSW